MTTLPHNTILIGDALTRLHELPTAAVDCCVTSPPFYQLRDYGVPGQLGLEATVEEWVEQLRRVLHEVARVLKPTGSLWLDLADSYSRHPRYGAPAKSSLLGPERLLLALAADDWLVRNKVIWAKPNPMPTSVADRLNTTYDVVYLLVRSPRYFFDLDAIREPHRSSGTRTEQRGPDRSPGWAGPLAGKNDGLLRARPRGVPGHQLGKNPGDVWQIATRGYRGAHFATFPEALVRRPLLATCPEAICTACGKPWKRAVSVEHVGTVTPTGSQHLVRRYPRRWITFRRVGDLVPCNCGLPTRPGVVLDPFFGTGTVGAVARELGRDFVGIELNPEYGRLAQQRLARSGAECGEHAPEEQVAA